MAYYSLVRYVADGVSRTFSVPFDYLEKRYVKVYVDGVEKEFIWISDAQVQLSQVPPRGAIVTIQRETPKHRLVDFKNASLLDEETLDRDGTQLVHIVQESLDKSEDALRRDIDDKYDANGKVIKNVGTPTDPGDAVNKAYADEVLTFAQAQANLAKTYAEQAGISAESAIASASSALNSSSLADELARVAEESAETAVRSMNKAELWASAGVSQEVEPGRYSAYHWASVAQDLVRMLLGNTRYEIKLVSPSGVGYSVLVTEAGSLRTIYSFTNVHERFVLVAEDGSLFEMAVTDEGNLYARRVTEAVADVVPEVTILAPNGWIYSITVTPDGELITTRNPDRTREFEKITFIIPGGKRFSLFIDENGSLRTVKEVD